MGYLWYTSSCFTQCSINTNVTVILKLGRRYLINNIGSAQFQIIRPQRPTITKLAFLSAKPYRPKRNTQPSHLKNQNKMRKQAI